MSNTESNAVARTAPIHIWKLSHGKKDISEQNRQQCIDRKVVIVHQNCPKNQIEKFRKAPIGDFFFLCHSNSLQFIGQFTSDAVLSAMPALRAWYERSYREIALVRPEKKGRRYKVNRKAWSPGGNSTFWRVPNKDLSTFESTLLQPFFGIENIAALSALASQAIGDPQPIVITPSPSNPESRKKPPMPCFNRIYYGPPGTGKTYEVQQLLERDYTTRLGSTLDAQSRQQLIADKVVGLKWWEVIAAALYDMADHKATVSVLAEHQFIKLFPSAGANRNVRLTLWSVLQSHSVYDSQTVNTERRIAPVVFDKSADSTWHLAGDWREACVDIVAWVDHIKQSPTDEIIEQKRYSVVTFHQSYGYEEFMEGLRPVLEGNNDTGHIAYEIRTGVFKELCRRARQAPNQRFAMVIDEINRGNISKIFGELITLIECSKRAPVGGPPPIEVTLPYSGERFSVPDNVDIIGTMNTADRSLALLDTALRRRFNFVAVYPNTREKPEGEQKISPLAGLIVECQTPDGTPVSIDIRRMLEKINERIELIDDQEHCIGHAYFMGLLEIENKDRARFNALKNIFLVQIIPLLEEYFFDDKRKVQYVLGQTEENVSFIVQDKARDGSADFMLKKFFDDEYDDYSHMIKPKFRLNHKAFENSQAYCAIYQQRN